MPLVLNRWNLHLFLLNHKTFCKPPILFQAEHYSIWQWLFRELAVDVWLNVLQWMVSPSITVLPVHFCYFAILDFWTFSPPAPSSPCVSPLMCILVEAVSSIFLVFCCLCRARSLRPAQQSAKNDHWVSGFWSVTLLMQSCTAKDVGSGPSRTLYLI